MHKHIVNGYSFPSPELLQETFTNSCLRENISFTRKKYIRDWDQIYESIVSYIIGLKIVHSKSSVSEDLFRLRTQ